MRNCLFSGSLCRFNLCLYYLCPTLVSSSWQSASGTLLQLLFLLKLPALLLHLPADLSGDQFMFQIVQFLISSVPALLRPSPPDSLALKIIMRNIHSSRMLLSTPETVLRNHPVFNSASLLLIYGNPGCRYSSLSPLIHSGYKSSHH